MIASNARRLLFARAVSARSTAAAFAAPFEPATSLIVFRQLAWFTIALCWMWPELEAAEPQASNRYGRGMHSFFAGDYRNAETHLTAAIKQGTRDPRPYYFRALTRLKLGRTQEAMPDFEQAGELESLQSDLNSQAISRSLDRIQGPSRVILEQYRSRALAKARYRQRLAAEQALEEAIRETARMRLTPLPPPHLFPSTPPPMPQAKKAAPPKRQPSQSADQHHDSPDE